MGAHEGILSVSSVHVVNQMQLDKAKPGIPSGGGANLTLSFYPMTQIKRVPLLIIQSFHVKFEIDLTKIVLCFMSTRSYAQSAKVDIDLLTPWPNRVRPSLPTTNMWSLKVMGLKLLSYQAHKFSYIECQSWPCPFTPWPKFNNFPLSLLTTCMWCLKQNRESTKEYSR